MAKGTIKPRIEWTETGGDYWLSEVLSHPSIIDDEDREIPFVLAIECLNWPDAVGVGDMSLPEKSYYKRYGAVWISSIHIIPKLPPEKIKNLDVGSEVEWPWYAEDAARYGYGCPVMPVPSMPGDSVWTSKMCPDAETAARIAIKYAEQKVLPNLDDVLAQPVNRMGELAENWLYRSIRPGR